MGYAYLGNSTSTDKLIINDKTPNKRDQSIIFIRPNTNAFYTRVSFLCKEVFPVENGDSFPSSSDYRIFGPRKLIEPSNSFLFRSSLFLSLTEHLSVLQREIEVYEWWHRKEEDRKMAKRENRRRSCTATSVIDSASQFTDGFTITIKLCSRGKLYS